MNAIASPPQPEVTTPQRQLCALLESAGVAPLPDTGWIRVTGEDRVRWLNGMTTNSIQQLAPGEGNYNFFLSAQGRIQGDGYAFALENSILIETGRARLTALMELLDRFVIMDDVELADISGMRFGLICAGPEAAHLLNTIGIATGDLPPLRLAEASWRGSKITVISAYSPLVPRFELWADSAAVVEELTEALTSAGAISVDQEALNHLRLLEGTPLYGTDIRDKELPQETAQSRALHFAKGCYLGQEIVERIRSRGNVHRTFHAFQIAGELPAAATALEFEGKPVGEITSAGSIPLAPGPVSLALGYIRREALERARSAGTASITYAGGTANPIGTPFAVVERQS